MAVIASVVALILLLLAGLYTFRQQSIVNQRLCEINVENRAALRATWEAVRVQFKETSDNPEAVDRFVDAILRPIPELQCVDNRPLPKEE